MSCQLANCCTLNSLYLHPQCSDICLQFGLGLFDSVMHLVVFGQTTEWQKLGHGRDGTEAARINGLRRCRRASVCTDVTSGV